MQTKNKQLLIRVSENELACITANAQEAGMTVSAYMREAGLNYAPRTDIELTHIDIDPDEIFREFQKNRHFREVTPEMS